MSADNRASFASLCTRCDYVREIHGPRTTFLMCGRAKEDVRFAKYPPQPVRVCLGFIERAPSAEPESDS